MGELSTEVTAISNLKQMKVIIRAELESLVDGFIAIGYYLKKTRDTKMYKEEGYEDIFDFAKTEFNLGRSSVYNYIAINDRFSLDGNSPELDEEYRGYGSSKLAEMLTLTDLQMQDLTPDATVKDIQKFKKIVNENESPDVWTNGLNTQSDADFIAPKNSLNDFIKYYFKSEGRNVFEKAIIIVLSVAGDREERLMYAIAPSKFKMIRVPGGITVICNADSVTVMKPGQAKEIFSYSELIEAIKNVFNPSDDEAAADTFKKYYQEDLVPVKVEVKVTDHKEEKQQEKKAEKKPTAKVVKTEPEKVSDDEDSEEEPEENSEGDPEEETEEDLQEKEPEKTDDEVISEQQEKINPIPKETKAIEGEILEGTIEETIHSEFFPESLSEITDYQEDAKSIQANSTIILANKLQKVMDAKQEYLKQVQEYKELATENGVTQECINYILYGAAGDNTYES